MESDAIAVGQQAWFSLCEQADLAAAFRSPLWQSLSTLYLAPTRAYHNLNHILDCLHIAQPYLPHTQDPLAVQLALWFHDAIYDPHAADNEAQSAVFAGSTLNTAGLSPSLVQEIQRLILTTASHQAEPGDRNAPLLLDADLAILGAAADKYQQYAQAIRQEYAWVDETSYRQGRGRVLQQFCQRERIYLTQPLYEQRETLARYNLQQELERLKHEELPQIISAR